jgi:outer membrane PBP1 activator LpoA protein
MQQRSTPVFRLLAAGALAVLLAACQTAPGDSGPASATRAERLLRQGNHAEAARMYEQLAANNTPPDRDEFALAATRAWLDANRADDAQRTLALSSSALPAPMQFERDLLQVEVAAARGQYQAAWQLVSALTEPARAQDASRLYYLRQQVALRAGQPGEAVQAGIARERVAGNDDNARTRARRDLLVDLRGAVERGVRIDPATSRDPLERGWLELARIAADVGRSPLSANVWVDRWRQRYPGHPASTIVGVEILDPASRPGVIGDRGAPITGPVALLLPLSDPVYGTFAGLVRDGFRSYVSRSADAGLADVREYDTGAMPVESAIQRALAEGATFIVGPLLRDQVQIAAEHRPVHVPMLLLNTLPDGGGPGPGAWQYALSPEDEARQIARQIAGSGGRGVVVLTPGGDWGQRVAAAFSAELSQSGGRVVHEGIYSSNNIEATITRALGIDAGRMRRERIQNVIGSRVTFNGYEQPAPEIDAIFAAGNEPLALRQIRPYLRQYNANDIPTYMTNDGIDEQRTANRDLSGMRVLEMPWHLDTVGAAYDVRQATEASWSSRSGQRNSRFFAFGYDAAMLASALRRGLPDWPLQGVTGRLSLTPDGRIERQLNWARVRDGLIEPSDPLSP